MSGDDADVLLSEVQRARLDANLSQVELAQVWGVDQGRVSNLLRGQRGARITAQQVMDLERACSLSAGTIYQRVAIAQGDLAYAASSGQDDSPGDPGVSVRPRGEQDVEPEAP